MHRTVRQQSRQLHEVLGKNSSGLSIHENLALHEMSGPSAALFFLFFFVHQRHTILLKTYGAFRSWNV